MPEQTTEIKPTEAKKVNLLFTVLDRGKGGALTTQLKEAGVLFNISFLGKGTANSVILDYFGLAETEKDVVLSMVRAQDSLEIMADISQFLHLERPGHGVAFMVPIGSFGGQKALKFILEHSHESERKTITMNQEKDRAQLFSLVVAIANKGYAEEVMDAARAAGARGGTILHAKGQGSKEAEHFFGITIEPEREVLLSVVPKEIKNDVLAYICDRAGLHTPCGAVALSVPVESVAGLSIAPKPGE